MANLELAAVAVGVLLLICVSHLYMDQIAKWLEARLEELEFHADRTHDGLMDGFIGFRDHSPFVLLSSTALLAFLILGPNLFWTPGDLPSREIQHASWYFGLTFPLWIAKHLLNGQRAGICWIGVMIGLGAIPAFFGDSWPLIITLLISCAAIFLFGLLSRLPDWLKENLENAQKWTQWFIWGLFYSGCALWFWSLVAEWNTGVKPNTLRLAALVITVGFLLIWAKRGWKPKRLGLVFFLIVAAWSIPMICATPWKLTGQTIVAATATWWCGERPSFSESGEPVAPAWHPDTLGWLVQKWPVPPHHGMTLALVFGVLAWLSVLISRWFVKNAFERFRNTFKFEEKLEELNPFENGGELKITPVSFRSNFIGVPWHDPIQAWFVPAIVLMRLHNLEGLDNKVIFFGTILLWWAFLGLGAAHPRLGRFREVVDRYFFQSGQFMLSLTLIALGGLQFLGVHYVTVVVEAAGWWVARTFLFLYFLLWVYEYWVNRQLTLRVCEMLAQRNRAQPICAAFESPEGSGPSATIHVQVHGAAKIAFIQKSDSTPELVLKRRTIDLFELFDILIANARANPDRLSQLKPPKTADNVVDEVRDIRQRINGYFAVMNFFLLAVVIVMVVIAWSMPGRPIVVANQDSLTQNPNSDTPRIADNAMPLVELRPLMFEHWKDKETPPKRVILIAASGGGTRAALYTASILDGLSQLDAIDDVVLTSGVSGGGASLAYFAMHRDRLSGLARDRKPEEWSQFHQRLAKPFIQEVLENWWELRMANGTSLGKLLAESFDRHFHSPNMCHNSLGWCASTASGPHPLAVIWNTTISGEFPANVGGGAQSSTVEQARLASKAEACRLNKVHVSDTEWGQRFHAQLASSYHAGGRLVFTNLKQAANPSRDAFALHETAFPDAPREHMRFEVVRDTNLELTSVAALAANFPPVFPNAAVDLEDTRRRFWVTDGGLMDNRGVLSLLLCLKQALAEQCLVAIPPNTPQLLPEIHVIVIEGSATSIDYSHDRGMGANSGAKAIIANQLMLELKDDVNDVYEKLRGLKDDQGEQKYDKASPEKIQYHYLTMPTVLRARGGLGTHWMLPNKVTLSSTESADPKCPQEKSIELDKEAMQELILWLNTVEPTVKPKAADKILQTPLETAKAWVKRDSHSQYGTAWGKLRDALKRQK